MPTRTRILIGALASVAVLTTGAAGYLFVISPLSCWTERCRTTGDQQLAATDEANARNAWREVTAIAAQRADIGTRILEEAKAEGERADQRTGSQLDRIEFMTSGMGSGELLSVGRPYLDQASALTAERSNRHSILAASAQPIDDSVNDTRSTIRGDLPPSSPQSGEAAGAAMGRMLLAPALGLEHLKESRLISSDRATLLSQALATNEAGLRSALQRYDEAIHQLKALSSDSHDARASLVAVKLPRDTKNEPDPTQVRTQSRYTGGDTPTVGASNVAAQEARARLNAEYDIARMNAQSEALRREADAMTYTGPGYNGSMMDGNTQ